jgi:hypothetical protein
MVPGFLQIQRPVQYQPQLQHPAIQLIQAADECCNLLPFPTRNVTMESAGIGEIIYWVRRAAARVGLADSQGSTGRKNGTGRYRYSNSNSKAVKD